MLQGESLHARSLAVVLAAAVGLAAACQGGLSATDAPRRSARAELARADAGPDEPAEEAASDDEADEGEDSPVALELAPDGSSADGGADAGAGNAERVRARLQAAAEAERARRLDLEFSEGLSEPPQQSVVASPPPWTPLPEAERGAAPSIEDVWPDKGPATGGERVVIHGRNLQPALVVFGLAPARIVDVSAAQDALTVLAPAGQVGRVAIVITNRDGSYAVSAGTFRYYD